MYAGKRKPVEGECPICVFDMEPGEDLVVSNSSKALYFLTPINSRVLMSQEF
jgi:hypothetical protein